jgi:hypothetical protein
MAISLLIHEKLEFIKEFIQIQMKSQNIFDMKAVVLYEMKWIIQQEE